MLIGLVLEDAVLLDRTAVAVLSLVAKNIRVNEVTIEGGVVARVAVEGIAGVTVKTKPDGVAKIQLQHDALALHLKEEADVYSDASVLLLHHPNSTLASARNQAALSPGSFCSFRLECFS